MELQRSTVKKAGGKKKGGGWREEFARMRFCMRVCLARSPLYEDTETRTPSCPQQFFPFPLFFMVGGEPPVTLRAEWASMKFPQMFYS